MFLGEDFLAGSSLVTDTDTDTDTRSDAQIDAHAKASLRRRTDLTEVFFYGIAPFGADGYPIIVFYNQPD